METSMADRLLGCFAKAVREKKELTEVELSSAYTEFMNRLQSITDGGQPIIMKLRRCTVWNWSWKPTGTGHIPSLRAWQTST